MAQDPYGLKARNGAKEEVLGLRGDRGGNTVGIDGGIVQALGLQEDLVAGPVGEPHHLVLDGGTVPRPATLDAAAIDRRLRKALSDDPVGLRGRGRHPTGDLGIGDPVGEEGKGAGDGVRRLAVQTVPGDGAAVQPRRRSGLEPPHGQAQGVQAVGKTDGRRFVDAACGYPLFPQVDDALEKGACGQDHPRSGIDRARRPHGPGYAPSLDDQVLDSLSANLQTRRSRQLGLHGLPIELPVNLRPWAADGGPPGPIEHAKLDTGGIS